MLRKSFQPATCDWALDSGGFSELSLFDTWKTTPEEYSRNVSEWSERIGRMEWAAIQDWMCEPFMLEKTGLSLQAHQDRTIQSYLDLRSLNPNVNWVPVIQGWKLDEYLDHIWQYRQAGIDLRHFETVGIGSVCRRQGTTEAEKIIHEISLLGINLHGFGFKFGGLVNCSDMLHSADSMAWSYNARRNPPLPECPHRRCANCIRWAQRWRERLIETIDTKQKSLTLF